MFKKNIQHLQPALISAISDLPEKQRTRLENSWAGAFYQEFFCRIKEEGFSVLYSDLYSRPNVPVNIMVGLESLKSSNGCVAARSSRSRKPGNVMEASKLAIKSVISSSMRVSPTTRRLILRIRQG